MTYLKLLEELLQIVFPDSQLKQQQNAVLLFDIGQDSCDLESKDFLLLDSRVW